RVIPRGRTGAALHVDAVAGRFLRRRTVARRARIRPVEPGSSVEGTHLGGDRILLRCNHIDLSPAIQLPGYYRSVEGEPAYVPVAGLPFGASVPRGQFFVLKATQRAEGVGRHDDDKHEEHDEHRPKVQQAMPGEWAGSDKWHHAKRNIDCRGEEAQIADPPRKKGLCATVEQYGDTQCHTL